MTVTYKDHGEVIKSVLDITSKHVQAAASEEAVTFVRGKGQRDATIVLMNVKDHRFLEATRTLSRDASPKIGKNKAGQNKGPTAFTKDAIGHSFLKASWQGGPFPLGHAVRYYNKEISSDFNALTPTNASLVTKSKHAYIVNSPEGQAAMTHADDFDFLQRARNEILKRVEKYQYGPSLPLQAIFAQSILNHYQATTGEDIIDRATYEDLTGDYAYQYDNAQCVEGFVILDELPAPSSE